ncbi:MAG: LLM class flavin-dependent oxidoreductase [Nostocoides sp.]
MSPRALIILSENDTLAGTDDLATLVDLAVEAERAGIDGVMLSEHVVLGPSAGASGRPSNPRDYAAPGNQDPTFPWPNSLVLLSAMASRTIRLRLVAGAVIFPLRHPLLLAKEFGTLDLLSQGRLLVLPTVSWHEDEYQALGVDFRRRGAILDEQLQIWRAAFASGPVHFAGHHFTIDAAYVEPRGYRPDGPRLCFGGSSAHPKVIERLARYGHAFNPFGPVTSKDVARLRVGLSAYGRDIEEIELIGGVRATLPADGSAGSLVQAMEAVPAQVAMGFDTICVKPSMFIDTVDQFPAFAAEVIDRLARF